LRLGAGYNLVAVLGEGEEVVYPEASEGERAEEGDVGLVSLGTSVREFFDVEGFEGVLLAYPSH
jgi:hypothetical protein